MRPTTRERSTGFQREYHHLRAALSAHLRDTAASPLVAQLLLDRTVALAAAPARGLLSPDLLPRVAAAPAPWRALRDLFPAIGRDDPAFAALDLPAELARRLAHLGTHDFTHSITLDVLGRLFERTLDPTPPPLGSRPARKLEGAYYTPPALAHLIAARTLDPVFQDLSSGSSTPTRLDDLTILDPACGAGAFLLAALAPLGAEYTRRGLRPRLLRHLRGVDLRPDSAERARICLWLAAGEPGTTLADLDATIRSGNSIIADPSLDPRPIDWPTFLPRGVDVVLGNPPFLRHEELAPLKPHLARSFPEVFHGGADLSVYFFALALRLLRPGGRLGYLGSNSWLRAAYAAPLRRLLRERATVSALLDLGDSRLFPDAPDVYPAILLAARTPAPATHGTDAAVLGRGDTLDALPARTFTIHLADHPDDLGWPLVPPEDRRLLLKLLAGGRPLGDRMGPLHAGLKTGLDDAFHLTEASSDRLLAADPTLAPLVRPFLRGEDLRPWAPARPARWLLALPAGWTDQTFGPCPDEQHAWRRLAERHPGLAAHLAPFADRGRRRRDRGDYWWELRPCRYLDRFARPKLVWPELAGRPRFGLDRTGACLNNKGFFAATDDVWLLPLLGSRPLWFVVTHLCLGLGERAGLVRYQLFARSIARLPLPEPDPERRAALTTLAHDLTAHAAARLALVADTGRRDLASLPPHTRDRLAAQHAEHARLTAALARLEATADAIAAELFDLTPPELALLRERTRYLYGAG